MSQKVHCIHVLFLKPMQSDHFLNRLTAYIGKRVHKSNDGYCHTEICLPCLEKGDMISSSIYNGGEVSLTRTKTFSNPGYEVHTMTVTTGQLARMLEVVHEKHRMGVKFDSMGMYLSILPMPIVSNERKTFCSKYVTEILKAGGVPAVNSLDPRNTTPTKLFKVLRGSGTAIAGTIEHRYMRLGERGLFSIE